jgi:hypothetical protein
MNTISLGQTDGGLFFPIKITENDHNILTASSIVEPNAQVLLGTPECLAIVADSNPQLPLADPQDRQGWYYINSSNTNPNKMNWYFYSGVNKGYRMADLRLITTIASLTNPLNKFFFVVYTKNGTSRTYETPELLLDGEKCLFFFGESGYIPNNEGNLREVRLLATHDDGLVLPNMEILYISIHSDSAFAKNSYAVCVERFGYRLDNITMDIILATPSSGGGGVSSDVNIISSVSLNVVNEALSNMYFTNSTFGNKLLNVFLPELTNIHIIGQEDDLLVKVVNIEPIKVVNSPTLNTLLINEASFDTLAVGGVSGSITLENSSIQSFFGFGVLSGAGTGGQLVIQFSIDNTTWYNTYNSFFISSLDVLNPTTFSSQYTFAIKYIRFIITNQAMSKVNINVCYK